MRRIAIALVALAACARPAARPTPEPRREASRKPIPDAPPLDATGDPAEPDVLAPLEAPAEETVKVDVDVDVRILAPVGARERRPIVVGIHGAHERAEWACPKWHKVFAGYAFVVCPNGQPWWPHRAWGLPENLALRADRAIELARIKYPAYVSSGPVVYGGFSQGGTLASQVVALRPGVYDTIVLVEVGHTRLNAPWAVKNLQKGNAARAVVSCATLPCLSFAKNMALAAKAVSFDVTINDAGVGRGHFFDEQTFHALGPALADLLADDPRWRGLRASWSL